MKRFIGVVTAMVFLALGAAGSALADSESRPATAAEKAHILKVLQVFDQAVPGGPEGWKNTERTPVKAPERMGLGVEESPFRLYYHAAWQDVDRKGASNARMLEEGARILEAEGDGGTGADQTRLEALAAQIGAAVERGDMAEVQRLQQEMEAVAARLNEAFASQETRMNDAVRAVEAHDVDAAIRIYTNQTEESFHLAPQTQAPVAGLPVCRVNDEGDSNYGWQEGATFVFLGDWRPETVEDYHYMRAPGADTGPWDAVRTIVVRVQAAPDRAREIIEQIDWDALKGLM